MRTSIQSPIPARIRYRSGLPTRGRPAERKAAGDLGGKGEDLLIGSRGDLVPVEDAARLEVGILADSQASPHPLTEVDLRAAYAHLRVLDHSVDHVNARLPHPFT